MNEPCSSSDISNDYMYNDPNLPEGWIREIVKSSNKKSKSYVVIKAPDGTKFDKIQALKSYLKTKNITDIHPSDINFNLTGKSKSIKRSSKQRSDESIVKRRSDRIKNIVAASPSKSTELDKDKLETPKKRTKINKGKPIKSDLLSDEDTDPHMNLTDDKESDNLDGSKDEVDSNQKDITSNESTKEEINEKDQKSCEPDENKNNQPKDDHAFESPNVSDETTKLSTVNENDDSGIEKVPDKVELKTQEAGVIHKDEGSKVDDISDDVQESHKKQENSKVIQSEICDKNEEPVDNHDGKETSESIAIEKEQVDDDEKVMNGESDDYQKDTCNKLTSSTLVERKEDSLASKIITSVATNSG